MSKTSLSKNKIDRKPSNRREKSSSSKNVEASKTKEKEKARAAKEKEKARAAAQLRMAATLPKQVICILNIEFKLYKMIRYILELLSYKNLFNCIWNTGIFEKVMVRYICDKFLCKINKFLWFSCNGGDEPPSLTAAHEEPPRPKAVNTFFFSIFQALNKSF